MEELYPVIFSIDDSFPIIYFVGLAIAIYKYRVVNSTVLCLSLLFAMDSLMNIIRDPLLALDSREVWYGTWIILDGLMVFMLYKSHSLLKVNLAKIANTVAWAYVVLAFVQTLRYMDRAFLEGAILDDSYHLMISAINISVATLVMLSLFKEEKPVGLYI